MGAACCVYLDGKPVVDIWAGFADAASSRPWKDDTLAVVFSTTKGATAICANLLIERGLLDPNMTVADVWPEFAVNGKETIPLRARAVPPRRPPGRRGRLHPRVGPRVGPGRASSSRARPRAGHGSEPAPGYHMRSYGWLDGEIVRRVTGQTLGQFFDEGGRGTARARLVDRTPRVARSHGSRPLLPPAAARGSRAARADGRVHGARHDDAATRSPDPSNLFHYDEMWNTRQLHSCELPSSNGIASARAPSRGCTRRPSPTSTVAASSHPRPWRERRRVESDGPDRVHRPPDAVRSRLLRSARHSRPRAGRRRSVTRARVGRSGFADPDRRVGFGYVMNQMQLGVTGDTRSEVLVRAVYAALGK